MIFDKTTYWMNREDGVRGQGEYPKTVQIAEGSKQGEHMVRIKGKISMVNRVQFRSRQKIRVFTKKGCNIHERNELKNPPVQLPKFPADLTNNARMIIRAETRAIYAEKARELEKKEA